MQILIDSYLITFSYNLDPCDAITCNGTNAVCQVVFGTGKPFCACALGFRGDPKIRCGKHFYILIKKKHHNYVFDTFHFIR